MSIDASLNTLVDRNLNTGRPASRQIPVDVRNTANRIFECGMNLESITWNPVRDCEISCYAPHHCHRTLTATEQRLIISTSHRAHVGALMIILIGLRRGELILLT